MDEDQLNELMNKASEVDRAQRNKTSITLYFALLTLLAVVYGVAISVAQPWLVAFLFTLATTVGILVIVTKE